MSMARYYGGNRVRRAATRHEPWESWAAGYTFAGNVATRMCQGCDELVSSGVRQRKADGTHRVLCYACGKEAGWGA